MPTKRKPSPNRPAKPKSRQADGNTVPLERLVKLYPSLAQGPTPAQRQEELLKEARARGIRPMNEEDLDAMAGAWPPDENLDEFLAWLRAARRTGRYA